VNNLVTTTQIFKGIMWFLLMDLALVALFIAYPQILTILPSMAS